MCALWQDNEQIGVEEVTMTARVAMMYGSAASGRCGRGSARGGGGAVDVVMVAMTVEVARGPAVPQVAAAAASRDEVTGGLQTEVEVARAEAECIHGARTEAEPTIVEAGWSS